MRKFGVNLKRNVLCVGMLSVALSSPQVLAENDADYATSLTLGSGGLGVNLSGLTPWSLRAGDQIQWRLGVSGGDWDFDKDDDVEIARIDYEGKIESFEARAGLDWYPSNDGWSENTFVSAGLMYVDAKFDGKADDSRVYYVGETLVSPGDVNSFSTLIETQQLMPYLSVGWGNKITGKMGFDFHAELGIRLLTENADIDVKADDPSNFLTSAAIAAERGEIKDEIDNDVEGFGVIAVSYHF